MYRLESLGGSFKGLTLLKYTQMKILAQYPARPPFRRRIKLSETLAICVTLLDDAFLECGLSHHCNGVAIIPVIDLDRNNTPEVRYSFAGFVYVSLSAVRSPAYRKSIRIIQSLFAMNVIRMCTESVFYKTILLHNPSEKVVHGPILRIWRPFRYLYLFVVARISWLL